MVRPIKILLVEDNPGDVDLTREALEQGRILNNLNVAKNGVEALAYLRRAGQYHAAVRPDLILLDLNLPLKSGREVLAEIKQDDQLKHIPVVVLTTSKSDQDVLNAYQGQANCYITKPVDLTQFLEMIKAIVHFWFSIVTLPKS